MFGMIIQMSENMQIHPQNYVAQSEYWDNYDATENY